MCEIVINFLASNINMYHELTLIWSQIGNTLKECADLCNFDYTISLCEIVNDLLE